MTRFPLTADEAAVASYVVGLVEALTATRGNIRKAAEALSMSEHTLRHRMKDLGLVAWNRAAHPLDQRQPKCNTCDGLGYVDSEDGPCATCDQEIPVTCPDCGGQKKGPATASSKAKKGAPR